MLYTLRSALAPWLRAAAPQPAAPELPNLKGHLPALDAIRGLAIVLVTLYRFGGGDHGLGRAVEADWLVEPGSRGVDLFFVLSGFLITGILFDAKGKEHYFRNFYVRRALRIFPLYYGVLAAAVFLLPLVLPSAAAVFQPADRASGVALAVRGECLSGRTTPAGAWGRSTTSGRWRSRSTSTWPGRW